MKKFVSMFCVLMVLVGIWAIYGKVSVVETRVTAVAGEYEESFSTKGIIIRNEYPIISEMEGTLQSGIQNGERVTKYTNVGFVYAGDASDTVIQELSQVNDRIEEINNMKDSTVLSLTDVDEISARITAYSDRIADMASSGNSGGINSAINDINMLVSRKRYLEGASQGENADLSQLVSRKETLESQLSGKRMNLSAPVSGLYFDFADGYESLSPDGVQTITEDTIKKVTKGEKLADGEQNAVCKIVDNSNWVVSTVISKEEAEGFAPGLRVTLRFSATSEEPVQATVHSLVASGKKFILNISGNSYVDGIYSERVCSVDIIKNTYKGLKIPADAIKNAGEKGDVVEVRTSGGIIEKTVKVLCLSPDGTAIVKAGNEDGQLLLYDDVIVRSKRQ